MTTENNGSNEDVIDALTSRWFDSETDDTETGRSAEAVSRSLDSKQRKQVVDFQLVHSLLIQLSDRNKNTKEKQIQQLMERIANETNAHRAGIVKLSRFLRPFMRYGAAALLILAFLFLLKLTPSPTATAAMAQVIAAFDQAGDRTYSILIEGNRRDRRTPRHERFDPPPPGQKSSTHPPAFRKDDRRDRRPKPFDRSPERGREPGERAVLDGSTLYLRGSDQFVLFRPTPSGRILINGCDGQTRWMIRPEKPVIVSSHPNAFPIPLPKELADILSLNLKETLIHIGKHYQVKYMNETGESEHRNGSRIYLDAERVSRDFNGPQNIEIWSEAETGLLLRIEFAGIHVEDYSSPVRMIIELTNQTPLAENWFTRQTHHSPVAEVYELSGEQLIEDSVKKQH